MTLPQLGEDDNKLFDDSEPMSPSDTISDDEPFIYFTWAEFSYNRYTSRSRLDSENYEKTEWDLFLEEDSKYKN